MSIQEHHSVKRLEASRPCIKVEDVVLLLDDGTKRSSFFEACRCERIYGNDDKVRAAVVKVCSDKSPVKLLKKNTQH